MIGAKPHEFRGWDYRPRVPDVENQRIVIHAGSRPIRRAEALDIRERILEGDSGLVRDLALPVIERLLASSKCLGVLPLACALGTVVVGAPVNVADLFPHLRDSDRLDHSKYGWPMRDPKFFAEPVPIRGFQGFWHWPLSIGEAA
jgi:hypothetical protein